MLRQHQRLRQAEGGEAARAIFGDVLEIAAERDPRARPGREVEADAARCARRSCRRRRSRRSRSGRRCGVTAKRAERRWRAGKSMLSLWPPIGSSVCASSSSRLSKKRLVAPSCRICELALRPSASRSSAMVMPARAAKSRPRYSIERAAGDPARVAAQIILVPGAAGQRQRLGEARAGVDADLARAVLRRVELADAEAGLALAGISEHVEAAVVMLGLDLPGRGGAALRRRRSPPVARVSLTATSARISVDGGRPVADVDAAEIGARRAVIVVDRGRGDLQASGRRCARRRGRRR